MDDLSRSYIKDTYDCLDEQILRSLKHSKTDDSARKDALRRLVAAMHTSEFMETISVSEDIPDPLYGESTSYLGTKVTTSSADAT